MSETGFRAEQWSWADARAAFLAMSGPEAPAAPPPFYCPMDVWHGSTVHSEGKPGSAVHVIAARRNERLQRTDDPTRLRKALNREIDAAITKVYDSAESKEQPPPNINQIGKDVLAELRAAGATASENQVKMLAKQDRHQLRRSPVGKRHT